MFVFSTLKALSYPVFMNLCILCPAFFPFPVGMICKFIFFNTAA